MRIGLLFFLFLTLFSTGLFPVNLSGLRKIHETGQFLYFAEDNKDYSKLFRMMTASNRRFRRIFRRRIRRKIRIYIFQNQLTFSRAVFHSERPVQNATGFADHRRLRFYITSYHDTCKPVSRLLKTPVHELVHLYFPSRVLWIREGVACYYSGMLYPLQRGLPRKISDMHFYVRGASATRRAYNCSSWLVRYIIEQRCHDDLNKFRRYAGDFRNFKIIGFLSEMDLFRAWRKYVVKMNSIR